MWPNACSFASVLTMTDTLNQESPVMICGSRPRHRVGALVLTRWKALALGSAEALLQEMLLIMAQIYSNDPRIKHSDNFLFFIIIIISSKQQQHHQQSTSLENSPAEIPWTHFMDFSTPHRQRGAQLCCFLQEANPIAGRLQSSTEGGLELLVAPRLNQGAQL